LGWASVSSDHRWRRKRVWADWATGIKSHPVANQHAIAYVFGMEGILIEAGKAMLIFACGLFGGFFTGLQWGRKEALKK
jgi:hypothetical protein